METDIFNQIFEYQMGKVEQVLVQKGDEYATEDRLHNFRVAANLQGVSLKQALAGMMAKHTTSIYDMCASEEEFDLEKWDEKITDHINYLFLLAAVIRDDAVNVLDPFVNESVSNEKLDAEGALNIIRKASM